MCVSSGLAGANRATRNARSRCSARRGTSNCSVAGASGNVRPTTKCCARRSVTEERSARWPTIFSKIRFVPDWWRIGGAIFFLVRSYRAIRRWIRETRISGSDSGGFTGDWRMDPRMMRASDGTVPDETLTRSATVVRTAGAVAERVSVSSGECSTRNAHAFRYDPATTTRSCA